MNIEKFISRNVLICTLSIDIRICPSYQTFIGTDLYTHMWYVCHLSWLSKEIKLLSALLYYMHVTFETIVINWRKKLPKLWEFLLFPECNQYD